MKIRIRMFFERHWYLYYVLLCVPLIALSMSDRLVWLMSTVLYYGLIGFFVYVIIKGN